LPADYDPDELLGVAQAYAGQVTLLDTCLGAFLDFFDGLPIADETLLTLTSARGFPLGEHGRVGPCDDALFGELAHVPWMMRFPDAAGAGARRPSLVEPADLWATLLDWWNIGDAPRSPTAESLLLLARGEAVAWRDRLCMAGGGGRRAIRTPAWFLRDGDAPNYSPSRPTVGKSTMSPPAARTWPSVCSTRLGNMNRLFRVGSPISRR